MLVNLYLIVHIIELFIVLLSYIFPLIFFDGTLMQITTNIFLLFIFMRFNGYFNHFLYRSKTKYVMGRLF